MDLNIESLGQIFILGFEKESFSFEFTELYQKWNLGGVILFSRNIVSPDQLSELISLLRSISKIPPFIMIDQEGGEVSRITKDFPLFPSNRYFGDRQDKEGLFQALKITARNLRRLGINVNLAPVVDVVTNAENQVIKERSFGSDPAKVAEFSKMAIQAIRSEGVLACAKHFPGIGDINLDPHQDLPYNHNSKERFQAIDFIPFKEAIKSEVDFIMSTHVMCPNLDPKEPASLSRVICQQILKEELKFGGLLITDDLGMGAIKKNYSLENAAEKAFYAGNDLILACEDFDQQEKILEHFKKLLMDKETNQALFSKRIEKIITKKKESIW
jgi:beta-N-acetylhexosaminidase